MTDIPVLFQPEMIVALLAGHKLQTRRLAYRPARKGEPTGVGSRLTHVATEREGVREITNHQRPSNWTKVKAGDRLWVREQHWRWGYWRWALDEESVARYTFMPVEATMGNVFFGTKPPGRIGARDDGRGAPGWYKRPSIFLPREHSRMTLPVTSTKIEPLQNISPQDAWEEGAERRSPKVRQFSLFGATAVKREEIYKSACVWEYEDLWKRINGEESWTANPDVVAVAFTVVMHNIDQMPRAA